MRPCPWDHAKAEHFPVELGERGRVPRVEADLEDSDQLTLSLLGHPLSRFLCPGRHPDRGRVRVGAPGREVDRDPGWTFCWAAPLLDDLGEIVGWVGMASEVTARRQAEGEARDASGDPQTTSPGQGISAINGRLMPMTLGLAYRPMACLSPTSCSALRSDIHALAPVKTGARRSRDYPDIHSALSAKAERHERVCGCCHSHQRRRNAPCRTPGCNLSPALDLDIIPIIILYDWISSPPCYAALGFLAKSRFSSQTVPCFSMAHITRTR